MENHPDPYHSPADERFGTAQLVEETVQEHLKLWLKCADATPLDLLCGIFTDLAEQLDLDRHAARYLMSEFRTYQSEQEVSCDFDRDDAPLI
jgi:hypothetical protein